MDEDTILRFCNKIKKDEATGCWNWIGATVGNYGCFRIDSSVCLAHRVSMHLFKGTPLKAHSRKEGLVLHKCNNSKCVNPNHLYVGNQTDNIKDCTNAGRRGTRGSTFSVQEINTMKILRNVNGYTLQAIADYYNVTKSAIHHILNN